MINYLESFSEHNDLSLLLNSMFYHTIFKPRSKCIIYSLQVTRTNRHIHVVHSGRSYILFLCCLFSLPIILFLLDVSNFEVYNNKCKIFLIKCFYTTKAVRWFIFYSQRPVNILLLLIVCILIFFSSEKTAGVLVS